jgi:hypothetical protein
MLAPAPYLVNPVAAAPGCNLNLPHVREPAGVHHTEHQHYECRSCMPSVLHGKAW